MTLEDQLSGWTGRSSQYEQDKQERAERMVREAVRNHQAFNGVGLSVFPKGSYANNTNVRSDSDVDIAVECTEVYYFENASSNAHTPIPYSGGWSPDRLRTELRHALQAKFPGQVDDSGSIALKINHSSARVDADVVPCFTYRYYFSPTTYRQGTRVFRKNGTSLENFPQQQFDNGVSKNMATGRAYKRVVRILKRTENALVSAGTHKALPSYFIECLTYNCPNYILKRFTWTERIKGALTHLYNELDGPEPPNESDRWLEANGIKFLFHPSQPWTRADGRSFAHAAWNYLGLN